jgi:hypothetical protein
VEFLKTLDQADLGPDEQTVMLLRVMGHGAIRIATLRQIQDPRAQTEYLERTAEEMAGSGLGIWAVDQLCDRASLNSMAVIEKAFREVWSGQYGEDQVLQSADICTLRQARPRRGPRRHAERGDKRAERSARHLGHPTIVGDALSRRRC